MTPDHARSCAGVRGPRYTPGQCRKCWLARYDPRHGGTPGAEPAAAPPRAKPAGGCKGCGKPAAGRAALPVLPPCPHEGAVSHACHCGDPARDVRFCDHPSGEVDRCVRGPSADPDVRSCAACELRPAGATPPAGPGGAAGGPAGG